MTEVSFCFLGLLHNLTKPSSQHRPDLLKLCHGVPRKKRKVISGCVNADKRSDYILYYIGDQRKHRTRKHPEVKLLKVKRYQDQASNITSPHQLGI